MSKRSIEGLRKAGMSEADITMRINGIVDLLEKNGKMTKKQVGLHFHKGEGWAGTYINEGIVQGKIVCIRRKFPQHFIAKSTAQAAAQATLPQPTSGTMTREVELPGHVWHTLRILQTYYGDRSDLDTMASIILTHANDLVISKHISLTAIEEEVQRHDDAMSKLKRGYA
jgi:hypothetical protein